jgi:GT2 family glycosyltransferase
MEFVGAIPDEDQPPAAIDLREDGIDRRVERGTIDVVDWKQKGEPRRAEENAAAYAAPERPEVLVPSRPGRHEPRLKGPQPGAEHDGQIERVVYHEKTVQFEDLARSRALLPAGFSRLIRHSTTIDPYLDESGPAARRLGHLALDGVSYDAIDLSTAMELRADIRTSGRSILRVPCAATDASSRGVTFEIAVTASGAADRRRRIQIAGDGFRKWHVLALRVPQGSLALTVRATADGEAAAGAVCGVPSLTWAKSPRAVSRSIAFAVRRLGLSGTVRYLRIKADEDSAAQYAEWRRCHEPTPAAIDAAVAGAALLAARPRFALFLETPDVADPTTERITMASLEAQAYGGWEIHRGGGADARNAAMARSTADFVGAIRAGDRLSPVALLRAAEAIAADPDVDVLYTDEDIRLADEEPARPRFKPDWSPELLHACMYMGRLLLVRRTLAIDAGGYRAAMEGALDYDLALRACPAARRVTHLSDVLYHRGSAAAGYPDSASPAAAAALQDVSTRLARTAAVAPGTMPGLWRVRVSLADRPRIAIVIPTDGQGPGGGGEPAFVAACVRSLRQRTRYPQYELLVCDNGNLTADTRAYLETVPHTRVTYRWEGAFNFPRKINFAVRQTSAPYVLLLNDDIEPINDGWLDAMLEYAHQSEIGAVGAKLFYPDGRLQHVGVAVGVCGVAAHLLHQHPGGTQGCGGIAVSARNCSAVTGACLLTRRQVYDEIGGFDEALALDFNDVDFCLRVRRAGYRIVFTPHARLFHHESASFGARRQRPEEVAMMWERWRPVLERDPYYNVNLTREFPDCRIRPCR